MRKIKGMDTMFAILVAVIAVILAAVIYYMVYSTASSGASAASMATATGQWAVPPSGNAAGTAIAIITIKTTGSVTIQNNPSCTTPQGAQYNPTSIMWSVAGQTTTPGSGQTISPPFTMGAGQVASAELRFPGNAPSVVNCYILTSKGELSVQIS